MRLKIGLGYFHPHARVTPPLRCAAIIALGLGIVWL
jgi:hypothetical protein